MRKIEIGTLMVGSAAHLYQVPPESFLWNICCGADCVSPSHLPTAWEAVQHHTRNPHEDRPPVQLPVALLNSLSVRAVDVQNRTRRANEHGSWCEAGNRLNFTKKTRRSQCREKLVPERAWRYNHRARR